MLRRALRLFILTTAVILPLRAAAEPTLVITPPEDPCRHISDLAKGTTLKVGDHALSMETFSYASCEYARAQVEASIRARLESLRSGVEERGKAELDNIYDRFLAWLAAQVRQAVYEQLTEEQRAGLSPDEHFKAWLKNPDQELSAYVNYYFQTHYSEFQPYLDRYRNDNSKEIIDGLSELWTKAKERLKKLTDAVHEIEAEPDAGPERISEILDKYGLSGPWIAKFRQYEARFNRLDSSYGIVDTAKMVHAAFTAEDYSGKLTGMFALMEKFGGYLSDSNVPGVSLIGTLIEAYGQIAKEALARANELEKLIRQREGHCIGLAAHTLLEKRSLALKALVGESIQACPLDEKNPFFKDIYEQTIPQDAGQLYFWNGTGFIKGRPNGGGRRGVEAAQRFIRDAATIGLVEFVGKETDMATIAAVYNTPYGPEHYLEDLPGHSPSPGLAGIIAEGEAVIEAITERIRRLRDGARLDAQCGEDDFATFIDRETSLLLSQYPLDTPELQDRLAFSYALGFVQKHNKVVGGSVGRAGIYDRYKRIWERMKDLSLLVLFGQVVDKRDRTQVCEDCAGAQIALSVGGGSVWSACGVTSADDKGSFVARIGTRSAEVSATVSATGGGVTSETLTIDKRALGLSETDVPFIREFAFDIELPLEGDEDTAQAALDALRGHHSAALKAFTAGQGACAAAKSLIAEAAAAREAIAARAEQVAERLEDLDPKRVELDRLQQRLDTAMENARKAAEAVVEAKQKGEDAALSACDLTAKLRKEDDEALQRRMLTEVRSHAISARTYSRAAERALTTAQRAAAQAEELSISAVEIAETAERAASDADSVLADAGDLEETPPALSGYRDTIADSITELDRIEPLAKAAFNTLKTEAGSDPELAEMLAEGERLYGEIAGFGGKLDACSKDLEDTASEHATASKKLGTVLDGLRTKGGTDPSGLAQLLAAKSEEARASADVAEVFIEAARAAATDADRCLKLAEAALTGGPLDDLAAAAEAAIAQCDFESAKSLLNRMKDSPSYTALANAYTAALERERQTKALFDRASAQNEAGNREEALRLLLSARTNTKCADYQLAINEAIAGIRGAGDDSLLAQVRAAIGACDFKTAREKIAELDRIDHPSFAEAQADYQAAVDRERRTRALFEQARARHGEGRTDDAIALLNEARANTECDKYRSRIDSTLAALSGTDSSEPAGDTDVAADGVVDWSQSYKGEIRLTRVIVNGSESSPGGLIQLIDREWRKERAKRPDRDGVIPAIGDTLYDVITGAVISVIGALKDGVPLSFALVPDGSAYRFALVGEGETASPDKLKKIPIFQPVDARTLRMTWQSEDGLGRATITLSADPEDASVTLSAEMSGRPEPDDADEMYNMRSLAATVEGRFEPGSIPAKQLEAALKNRVKAAARRYAPHFKID